MIQTTWDLVRAVRETHGMQQDAWKGALCDRLMQLVHEYADACAAQPLVSANIEVRHDEIHNALKMTLALIPGGEEAG